MKYFAAIILMLLPSFCFASADEDKTVLEACKRHLSGVSAGYFTNYGCCLSNSGTQESRYEKAFSICDKIVPEIEYRQNQEEQKRDSKLLSDYMEKKK